jgi:hypothetical protein
VKINNNGYNAYYNYDGGGQRVRKVIKNDPIKKVRLYLGGVECYRVYAKNTLKEETWTLQVDGIAQVDTKTVDNKNVVANPAPLIRYHLEGAKMSVIKAILGIPNETEKYDLGENYPDNECCIYIMSSCFTDRYKGKIIFYSKNDKIIEIQRKYGG